MWGLANCTLNVGFGQLDHLEIGQGHPLAIQLNPMHVIQYL